MSYGNNILNPHVFLSLTLICDVADILGMHGFEVEDDILPDFQCPYCYEEFDILSLCAHVEDEHQDESKITVGLEDLINLTACRYILILGTAVCRCVLWQAKEIGFHSSTFGFIIDFPLLFTL